MKEGVCKPFQQVSRFPYDMRLLFLCRIQGDAPASPICPLLHQKAPLNRHILTEKAKKLIILIEWENFLPYGFRALRK